jgi:hypothetical protein
MISTRTIAAGNVKADVKKLIGRIEKLVSYQGGADALKVQRIKSRLNMVIELGSYTNDMGRVQDEYWLNDDAYEQLVADQTAPKHP